MSQLHTKATPQETNQMTTAVLNEKRYALSFACLMVALFWAGVMFLSLHAFARANEQHSDTPTCSVVKKDA